MYGINITLPVQVYSIIGKSCITNILSYLHKLSEKY